MDMVAVDSSPMTGMRDRKGRAARQRAPCHGSVAAAERAPARSPESGVTAPAAGMKSATASAGVESAAAARVRSAASTASTAASTAVAAPTAAAAPTAWAMGQAGAGATQGDDEGETGHDRQGADHQQILRRDRRPPKWM